MKKRLKNLYSYLVSIPRSRNKLVYDLATPVQKELLSFEKSGYLSDMGWIISKEKNEPCNRLGDPIPWITYSAIEFLNQKLQDKEPIKILEFGSGNSTLYFANKRHKIRSIEHDYHWYNKMKSALESFSNVELQFKELRYGGSYCQIDNNELYDLVIVDGRDRVNCAINAHDHLTKIGIVMLDDSERKAYKPAIDFYQQQGFKRIDFWGIAPSIFYNKCTTFFYRSGNVLDI